MAKRPTRRTFLRASTGCAMALGVPAVVTSKRTRPTGPDQVVIGDGEFRYRVNHQVVNLPDKFHWQFTHNIAVDSSNNIYVIHEGDAKLKDHPSIFVFGPDGKFIRAFGSQFQGGGHGLEVRKEGSEDFIYVTAYKQRMAFAKLTTSGEIVWHKKAPMESGVYAKGQDTATRPSWNRKGFLPTNFTFLNDGGFLLADGYGSFFIHQFDKDANWVKCFGGPGEGQGTFNTSHGLWIDHRPGRSEPSLVVTDHDRNTLQRLTLNGNHIETLDGFLKPANIDVWDNQLLVAELGSRLTLLDEQNNVLVHFDAGVKSSGLIKNLIAHPEKWQAGHFIAPHDACFDLAGDIFVAERIPSGRITKLTKV